MALPKDHIGPSTRMGANLEADGATFRVWAPAASAVYVNGVFSGVNRFIDFKDESLRLEPEDPHANNKRWVGFLKGAKAGDQYKFYVVGPAEERHKRDPYARELTTPTDFPGSSEHPSCNGVIRAPGAYPWRSSADFRPPAFNDLIIYLFHVGTYSGPDANRADCRGTFLDVLDKVEHLKRLGVNAIEPLPIQEAKGTISIGYNNTDFFSPEMAYTVPKASLKPYVELVNRLLKAKGKAPLRQEDLEGGVAQLKALVDIFHLYGIAVFFDVVYNHAGPFTGDDDGLYFFDLQDKPRNGSADKNKSLYFTDQEVGGGGQAFAYWNQDVRQFLIDNASFVFEEYRIDGLRFDLVSEIENKGGVGFCRDLTNTLRTLRPQAPLIAEYWNDNRPRVVTPASNGLGFDAAWSDQMRNAMWKLISEAAGGASAVVNVEEFAGVLDNRAHGFPNFWHAVTNLETHDEVQVDRRPRIPTRADSSNSHSWFARSRTRVANAILLTAPGIPMLFMGQEFMEDKQWKNDGRANLIYFDGLDPKNGNRVMQDFYFFMQELVALRRRQPALRGECSRVTLARNNDRILVMHRWLEGFARDVLVVVSLNERTFNEPNYQLGFPGRGRWEEVFNSDFYDDIGRRTPFGNGGAIVAEGPPMDGFETSAGVVIPANSVLVFARDYGDT